MNREFIIGLKVQNACGDIITDEFHVNEHEIPKFKELVREHDGVVARQLSKYIWLSNEYAEYNFTVIKKGDAPNEIYLYHTLLGILGIVTLEHGQIEHESLALLFEQVSKEADSREYHIADCEDNKGLRFKMELERTRRVELL